MRSEASTFLQRPVVRPTVKKSGAVRVTRTRRINYFVNRCRGLHDMHVSLHNHRALLRASNRKQVVEISQFFE